MEIRRTPGYPLLLTLGVLADRIAAVTIAVQILFGTATVWMVALLARRVIGAGTGDASRFSLWAAAAYALDPLSILYPSLLLTETLFTAVFVVHLLALLLFLETRAVGTAALAGVLAAASTFVRPVAYFWPFVATAIMLCTLRRTGIRGCATFLVLAVLPCVLWAVRNDVQGGYFGFSAIRDRNLYSYNAAAVLARIEGARFDDVRTRLDARLEELEEAGGLDTYAKRAEYMGREGLRIIRDHPVAFLEVHLSGIVRVIIDPGFTQYLRPLRGAAYERPHNGDRPRSLDRLHPSGARTSYATRRVSGVLGGRRHSAQRLCARGRPCLEDANIGRDGAARSGGVFPGRVWRPDRVQPISASDDANESAYSRVSVLCLIDGQGTVPRVKRFQLAPARIAH